MNKKISFQTQDNITVPMLSEFKLENEGYFSNYFPRFILGNEMNTEFLFNTNMYWASQKVLLPENTKQYYAKFSSENPFEYNDKKYFRTSIDSLYCYFSLNVNNVNNVYNGSKILIESSSLISYITIYLGFYFTNPLPDTNFICEVDFDINVTLD